MVWALLFIIAVLAGLAVWTFYTQKQQPPAAAPQAPWEREGGQDLTAPSPRSFAARVPDCARMRPSASEDQVFTECLLAEVTQGLERIPPLPQAVHQILKELQSVGSSARSVGSIVATEPVLSAALLRLANSAAMGIKRRILTVDEAVAYLGFSTVRALAVRMKLGPLLAGGSETGVYNARNLWVHSIAVSQLAEMLARRVGRGDPYLPSTLGLLHDLGKLAIVSHFPEQSARIRHAGDGPADESFLAREARLFGADHASIGGQLARRWNLPPELTEGIRLHHHFGPIESPPDLLRAIRIVQVANQLAKYCHVYCEDMEIDIVPPHMLHDLGMPQDLESGLDLPVQAAMQRALAICGEEPQALAAAG